VSSIAELRPGLWRWTARHPEWRPGAEPESADDWPPEVGCVAYAAPRALVLVDPLLPDGDAGLARALDAIVERQRKPVLILTTIAWHRRSREELGERYGARLARRAEGIEPVPIRRAGETMFWIPEHRALVPGDRLLGDGRGGLRVCPQSWLRYLPSRLTVEELGERLRPLLELPVEMVLVSHGEPVLRGGWRAIAEAIGEPR